MTCSGQWSAINCQDKNQAFLPPCQCILYCSITVMAVVKVHFSRPYFPLLSFYQTCQFVFTAVLKLLSVAGSCQLRCRCLSLFFFFLRGGKAPFKKSISSLNVSLNTKNVSIFKKNLQQEDIIVSYHFQLFDIQPPTFVFVFQCILLNSCFELM